MPGEAAGRTLTVNCIEGGEELPIPKVIHYCWFGENPKNKMVLKCIRSWKRYCPGYEIMEWNETNFDVNAIPYTAQAYACGKWAFVSDYARLKIIYDCGGIYLDTDVELKKPLDPLLLCQGFLGLEKVHAVYQVNTGLGFGAVRGHPLIQKMMESYHSLSFLKPDGSMDLQPCSERNTELLRQEGFDGTNRRQLVGGTHILPTEYLCPMDYVTGEFKKTRQTVSIHHYQATWLEEETVTETGIKHLARKLLGKYRYRRWAAKKRRWLDPICWWKKP